MWRPLSSPAIMSIEKPWLLPCLARGATSRRSARRLELRYWQMVAPLVITGLGMSMTIPAAQSAVMSHVAPQHIGKASGTFTTVRQLGGAFGVAIAVAVFASAGGYQSAQAFSDGFGPALGVCAGLALAAALVGLLAPGRPAALGAPRVEGAAPSSAAPADPSENAASAAVL